MTPSTGADGDAARFALQDRFDILRALVRENGETLQTLSDLQADLEHLPTTDAWIRRPLQRLLDDVMLMAQELNLLTGDRHTALYAILERLRGEIRGELRALSVARTQPEIVSLRSDDAPDESLVGGKAAGVALLRRALPGNVPDGFVVTTAGYERFLDENQLRHRLRLLLQDRNVLTDRRRFLERVGALQSLVRSASVPAALRNAIETHAGQIGGLGPTGWAVRSSAIHEDSAFSFAGQFETVLGVPTSALSTAYVDVLASRFSERAIAYRLSCGLREIETPMAVLFMPLVEARASGVVQTALPNEPEAQRMLVSAAPVSGHDVMQGRATTDTFVLSRSEPTEVLEVSPASPRGQGAGSRSGACMTDVDLVRLGALALQARTAMGVDLEMEWVLDPSGHLWLLQGRRQPRHGHDGPEHERIRQTQPLSEAGVTIFPGRAEGRLVLHDPERRTPYPRGAVLLVQHPTPDLTPLLPELAALLAVEGSAVSHLAVLLREFAVPSLFGIGGAAARLPEGAILSVDATRRQIYEGSRWPSIRERVLARISTAQRVPQGGPLSDRVLRLNLTDPFSPQFKASSCSSVHDVIRYIHEMSVRALFRFGDHHRRFWTRRTRVLHSELPVRFHLLELDRSEADRGDDVLPVDLHSAPFQAFWRGYADPRLSWPQRWSHELAGMPAYFRDQVFGGARGSRRDGAPNYLIVGHDYMNLNARYSFHYAMVDAHLGPGRERNYIHFRFHSGGSSGDRQRRRARFLERVLRQISFGVDCRGDLLTAWFRRYNTKDSERALETLGRLMVCARQLDLLMRYDEDVKIFSEAFLEERYRAFS